MDGVNSKLQDFSKGQVVPVGMNFKTIIEGRRLRHSFIDNLVKQMREKNVSDKDILDLLLIMDKGVEAGELNEDNIFND